MTKSGKRGMLFVLGYILIYWGLMIPLNYFISSIPDDLFFITFYGVPIIYALSYTVVERKFCDGLHFEFNAAAVCTALVAIPFLGLFGVQIIGSYLTAHSEHVCYGGGCVPSLNLDGIEWVLTFIATLGGLIGGFAIKIADALLCFIVDLISNIGKRSRKEE